jgi:P27 family predicted phage terminase small subunit
MQRGPKPKPTKDKKAKGTHRSNRSYYDELQYDLTQEIPPPPTVLDEFGKREWDIIMPQLKARGVLSVTDHSIILAYCLEMQTYFEARCDIKREGKYLKSVNKRGGVSYAVNPNVSIGDKAISNAIRIATEFGFSPSSRTRISTGAAKTKENPEEVALMKLSKSL